MRNTSVQSELEKIRDQKEKWAEDYAPPARVLDDKATTHTLEQFGRQRQDGGRIGDHWPVYHFRPADLDDETGVLDSKPVVVYFHAGGFYRQVSRA
jgi:acetyl esterase/lipase